MAAAERHPHAAGAHIGEHRLVLQIGSGKQLAVNQAAFLAVLENLDHQIVLGFELVEDIGAVFRLPQGGGGDGAVFGHSVFFHHLGIPPQHGGERPHRLGADVPVVNTSCPIRSGYSSLSSWSAPVLPAW